MNLQERLEEKLGEVPDADECIDILVEHGVDAAELEDLSETELQQRVLDILDAIVEDADDLLDDDELDYDYDEDDDVEELDFNESDDDDEDY